MPHRIRQQASRLASRLTRSEPKPSDGRSPGASRRRARGPARLAVALAAYGLIAVHAAPAAAQSSTLINADREASVPVVLDALVLRPLGLVMTAVGAAIFAVPVAPVMAVTRPTDMGKPFRVLVVNPARYTFVDPLGLHPPRS